MVLVQAASFCDIPGIADSCASGSSESVPLRKLMPTSREKASAYELQGFKTRDCHFPYEFIGFAAMDGEPWMAVFLMHS